jgi:hypothetical protein
MSKTILSNGGEREIRWEAIIPLFTNPFLWFDFGKALLAPIILFGGLIGFILAGDNDPDWAQAFGVLALCLAAVAALFAFVELVVFRNRMAVRYALDDKEIAYESGRPARAAQKIGVVIGVLARSPLLVGGSLLAASSNSLTVRWRDVKKVTPFAARKVITLSNSWRPVLRVYCPDAETYESARRFIAARVTGARDQSR